MSTPRDRLCTRTVDIFIGSKFASQFTACAHVPAMSMTNAKDLALAIRAKKRKKKTKSIELNESPASAVCLFIYGEFPPIFVTALLRLLSTHFLLSNNDVLRIYELP